jgi:hypothetical protein
MLAVLYSYQKISKERVNHKNEKTMKLAVAFSLLDDLQESISQLASRLKDSSKVQEGDSPEENVEELMVELDDKLSQREDLIYRIILTFSQPLCGSEPITRMMAHRDRLERQVYIMDDVIGYATEIDTDYSPSKVKYVRLIDVTSFRKRADNFAKQLRGTEMKIEELNWTVELK